MDPLEIFMKVVAGIGVVFAIVATVAVVVANAKGS